MKSRYKVRLLLLAVTLFLFSTTTGCVPAQDFDSHLKRITDPYQFNITQWEFRAFTEEIGKLFSGRDEISDNVSSEVVTYFANVEKIQNLEREIEAIAAGDHQGNSALLEGELGELRQQNLELTDNVERLLESQIRQALSREGIFNPMYKYVGIKIGFPPVNFTMGKMPHLLVVSPRDRIESIREITLLPEMSREDMERIETEIDSHDVSSLVVELGGLATYPSFVTDTADPRFILNTIGEEWLHQYLTFTPLGFLYVLDLAGFRRDYEIATMNETIASMISKEIGAIVYEEYYSRDASDEVVVEKTESGFDFNLEMRQIRKAVDNYLAMGEIEKAEIFMEMKRQYLAENGYHIRKLNQAYFAFHGAYADSPTSISPIGIELRKLRSQSDSMDDFLDTVTDMTSREELAESVR